jgi:Zn-dependent alcohol dehydrogenase
MTAIAVEGGKGPAEAMKPVTLPRPVPGPGQLLVKVEAAGINRPDLIQRMGFYPPPPGSPDTMGLEISGEVIVGAGRWKAGDRVTALLGGGGYAEYAVVDARHALPTPKGLSAVEAAALPETVFTVFANVFEHGGLKAGETLLVHGATSGIGTTAIQMAKAAGAKVIATARGADKAAQALKLGADVAVDATAEDFAEVAKAGVIHLTRVAAAEVARDGVRVNAICPGLILTNIFTPAETVPTGLATMIKQGMAQTAPDAQPIAKPGLPADIANAALFFASDESAFVTGVHMLVDGGMFVGPRNSWDPEMRAERMKMMEARRAAFEAAEAEDGQAG